MSNDFETVKAQYLEAIKKLSGAFESKGLSKYISMDDFNALGNQFNTPSPDLEKVQKGLIAMQDKMSADLGQAKADALLKEIYGPNFNYAGIIAGLPADTTPGSPAPTGGSKQPGVIEGLLNGLGDNASSAMEFIGENKKTSLLVALCSIAGLAFVRDMWKKPSMSGVAIGIAMVIGLFAMAEGAIGAAKSQDFVPPKDKDRQEQHDHNGKGKNVPDPRDPQSLPRNNGNVLAMTTP